MIACIDEQVKDKCWNLLDSYGEICVHCGCCAKDRVTRYKSRVDAIKGWIWEQENWYKPDETWEEYQRKNRREKMRHWKRLLRYYENGLNGLGART